MTFAVAFILKIANLDFIAPGSFHKDILFFIHNSVLVTVCAISGFQNVLHIINQTWTVSSSKCNSKVTGTTCPAGLGDQNVRF